MNRLPSPLLIVTERSLCPIPLGEQVEKLFAAGARWLWLRDKDLPFDARKALALQLKQVVEKFGGTFSVGADIVLAKAVGASSAHVSTPQDVQAARAALGQQALIGMSAHSLHDVPLAKNAGADYVTLSPIYSTSSKPGYGPALGTLAISAAAQHGIAIVALGGLSLASISAVQMAGAQGVAMMGEAMKTQEAEVFIRTCLTAWPTS